MKRFGVYLPWQYNQTTTPKTVIYVIKIVTRHFPVFYSIPFFN
jgi:hypothetical protein